MTKSNGENRCLEVRFSSDDPDIRERTPGVDSLDHSSMSVHRPSFCRLRRLSFLYAIQYGIAQLYLSSILHMHSGRFKSCEIGPVILSAAKNLCRMGREILRCAQNDRAI